MNGTVTLAGALYHYTVVDAADPLRALVTYALDGHPCGYGIGALDAAGFTPWCRCEHMHPENARACHRASKSASGTAS